MQKIIKFILVCLCVLALLYKCALRSQRKQADAVKQAAAVAANEERNAYLRKTLPLWAKPEAIAAFWNRSKLERLSGENGEEYQIRASKANPLTTVSIEAIASELSDRERISTGEGRQGVPLNHTATYDWDTFTPEQLLAAYFFCKNKHFVPSPPTAADDRGPVDFEGSMRNAYQYTSRPLVAVDGSSRRELFSSAPTATEVALPVSSPGTPLSEVKYPHILVVAGQNYLLRTSPTTTRRVTANSDAEALLKAHAQ